MAITSVMIYQDKLDELLDAQSKLQALENGGVDNWEFYVEALGEYFKEKKRGELIDQFIQDLGDVLVDAKIDEPADRGAGYSIEFNEQDVKKLVANLIREYNECNE